MKHFLAALAIALGCLATPAQEVPSIKNAGGNDTVGKLISPTESRSADRPPSATDEIGMLRTAFRPEFFKKQFDPQQYGPNDAIGSGTDAKNEGQESTDPDDVKTRYLTDTKFHWKGALVQSAAFLAVQHGFRMTEEKTRSELDGPFFRDWKESVANLRGWDDGVKFFTNYIAHPMQGAITSRIFIHNSGKSLRQEFGGSKPYWSSRMKAMAWSALWSLQFEIGPISESSLGNVGQRLHDDGRSRLTYLDIVITPTVGTGLAIAEDMIDKYVLRGWVEKKIHNKALRNIISGLLTPTTSFANMMRFHSPWYRERLQK